MELKNQSDHIAILSLMMVGTLVKRLNETGGLDEPTKRQLHRLVQGVRTHAKNAGLDDDLHIMFDNLDRALGERASA